MVRVYVQGGEPKVLALAKRLGATYVEGEDMVFKCPFRYKENAAVALMVKKGNKSDFVIFGSIDSDCDNFDDGDTPFSVRELDWALDVIDRVRRAKFMRDSKVKVLKS